MKKERVMKNITKISIVCMLSVIGVESAQAIPSVRSLGGAGTYAGTSSATVANTKAGTGSLRASSLRAGRIGVTPATVSKVSASDSSAARLSLGKLLHNTGIKKGVIQPTPTTPSTGPTISDGDLTSLQNRIHAIESDVANMTSRVSEAREHILDTNSHVSTSDRDKWNAKQDALTAGSGISIENGVISSTVTGGGESNVSDEDKARWNAKQDALTPGTGIAIENGIISSTNTSAYVSESEKATWNAKQDALTAGSGISIENGVISSTVTHTPDVSDEEKATWNAKQDALTAGSGISIENGVISSDIDTSLSVSDMESTSGKMVSGVSVNDRVIHVQRANVKIPVGSETASPSATIWIE